jgi:hypothetical protein
VRDDNYLHYIDCETWVETKVNMNANGDDHVSFTVLDLARSPGDERFLLAATDKSRHIVFRTGTSAQVSARARAHASRSSSSSMY